MDEGVNASSEEEEIAKPVKKSDKKLKKPNREIVEDDIEDLDEETVVKDVQIPAKPDKKKGNKKPKQSKSVEEDGGAGDLGENGKQYSSSEELKADYDDPTEEISEKLASTEISSETPATIEKKLTHKEKKKMKKQQEYENQMETLLKKGGQGHSDLDSNFTVSQMQKTVGQMAALENAVDIKIENFSISAKGNDLFVNANLLIAQGRHYGLVGPNG